MNAPKTIKKVDFAEYEGKYDESVNDELTTSPEDLSVETMREYLYGYTFTEDYAKGEFPDEMSMDYWRDSDKGICDFEADFPCFDRNKMPECVWDTKGDDAFDIIDEILDDSEDEIDSIFDDNYRIDTLQERRILEAIDSTGENGACPPTRSGSIHPILSRKTAEKRLRKRSMSVQYRRKRRKTLEKTEHCRSLVVRVVSQMPKSH